jgi:hypothetical protein
MIPVPATIQGFNMPNRVLLADAVKISPVEFRQTDRRAETRARFDRYQVHHFRLRISGMLQIVLRFRNAAA